MSRTYGENLASENAKLPSTKRLDDYPEHKKLLAIKDKSQVCGEFHDWLENEKGMVLDPSSYKTVENLLAEFFEIDQTKLENEKDEMIADLRKE